MKSDANDPVPQSPASGHGAAAAAALHRQAPDFQSAAHGKPRRGIAALIVMALIVGGLGALIYYRTHTSKAAAGSGSGGPGGRSDAVVPVIVGVVATKDVPLYLDGLGTVQAFNTVTVHSRVDGQLVKISFTEGQDVKTGDVLAQIDSAPYQAALNQVLAKKSQDQAQLANARVDLQRYTELLKADGITRQIYDTQKALVAQLDASIQADEAAIESARVNLDYATIRSPIDGRVGIRQVDQGNIVHANDANGLVVLTQLRPISLVFTLPEQMLPKVRRSMAEFPVLAVSRDNTNLLAEGQLAVVDNQIDSTTGTIKLKATFANENLRLWPGQFVNARLLLNTRSNGVVVPASVVQRGPEGPYAFVIQEDQTVKMRSLKVAQIEAGEALIEEGLEPGEQVVVDGQYKLQPGSKVKAAEASAAKAKGAGDGKKGGQKKKKS